MMLNHCIKILFILLFASNCYALETISEYSNETISVLNEELRKLNSSINSVNTSVNAINSVPSGIITMWSGTIATIPSGWLLCDGTNGTPDLRDRFIVGATSDDSGVAKTNVTGSLTQSGDGQIPTHYHSVGCVNNNDGGNAGVAQQAQSNPGGSINTGSYGTGTKVVAVYYALCFIMRQ